MSWRTPGDGLVRCSDSTSKYRCGQGKPPLSFNSLKWTGQTGKRWSQQVKINKAGTVTTSALREEFLSASFLQSSRGQGKSGRGPGTPGLPALSPALPAADADESCPSQGTACKPATRSLEPWCMLGSGKRLARNKHDFKCFCGCLCPWE